MVLVGAANTPEACLRFQAPLWPSWIGEPEARPVALSRGPRFTAPPGPAQEAPVKWNPAQEAPGRKNPTPEVPFGPVRLKSGGPSGGVPGVPRVSSEFPGGHRGPQGIPGLVPGGCGNIWNHPSQTKSPRVPLAPGFPWPPQGGNLNPERYSS